MHTFLHRFLIGQTIQDKFIVLESEWLGKKQVAIHYDRKQSCLLVNLHQNIKQFVFQELTSLVLQ